MLSAPTFGAFRTFLAQVGHAVSGASPPLTLAAHPVLVSVEAMRVRVGYVVPNAEVPVRNVAAVEVWRRRRDADGRVRGMAVTRWWRRGRRRRRYSTRSPQSTASGLRGSLGSSIGAEALEPALVHVDLPEPARDELPAEIAVAAEDDVGEQASVPISRVLSCIADQTNLLALSELPRPGFRLSAVTLSGSQLRRVDPDEANALPLPAAETNVDGVAIHDGRDGASEEEAASISARRRRRSDHREGDPGEDDEGAEGYRLQ